MSEAAAPARYRPDWRWILALSAVLMVLTTLPVAWGYLRQTPELRYLGNRAFSPADYPVYYAWIRQAAEGEWLLANRFTSEPAWGSLNLYWVAVGKLAAFAGLTPAVVFQLARVATIPLLLLALDFFFAQVGLIGAVRRLALVVIAFGGGVSAYAAPWLGPSGPPVGNTYPAPLDLWVPESLAFASAAHSGHLAAALALQVLVVGGWAGWLRTWRWPPALAAGAAVLALFSFHPFEAPLLVVLLAAATVVWAALQPLPWRAAGQLAVAAALASLPLLYTLATMVADPVASARMAQNVMLSPPAVLLPLSLGLLGVVGVVGWWAVVRRAAWRRPGPLLLALWLPLQLVLLHAPVPFQRRMAGGLLVPWVSLGAPVLWAWIQRAVGAAPPRAGRRLAVVAVAAFLLVPGPIYLLGRDLRVIGARPPSLFRPAGELEGLAWLAERTPHSAVVLAAPPLGLLVPAYAGRTTVVGHGVETADALAKASTTAALLSGRLSPLERDEFVRQQRVTHLLVSSREPGFFPGPWLQRVFSNGAVGIYAVRRALGAGEE